MPGPGRIVPSFKQLLILQGNHASMTMPSDLGVFGKLPPEIRLCIWDLLVPSKKHCFMNEGKTYDITPRRRRLTIMCTSQRLHDEVSYHLYGDFQVKVRIKARDPRSHWIKLAFPKLRARWGFYQNASDNFEQVFGSFPFHKAHLDIHLCGPDPRDRGQVVLLWRRFNRFITFLVDRPPVNRSPVPNINLFFDQSKKDWQEAQNSLSLKRLNLKSQPFPDEMFYDHEALALQLFRLENCQPNGLPQSKINANGLDWSHYNHLLSIAYPSACLGPLPPVKMDLIRLKDSDVIQQSLKDISLRMEFELLPSNSGPTAKAVAWPCFEEQLRLLNEKELRQKQELQQKEKRETKLRKKERKRSYRRTNFGSNT